MGPGPLELFPFVVLAVLMAMAGGFSEHMLSSLSSCRYVFKKYTNLKICFEIDFNIYWIAVSSK